MVYEKIIEKKNTKLGVFDVLQSFSKLVLGFFWRVAHEYY